MNYISCLLKEYPYRPIISSFLIDILPLKRKAGACQGILVLVADKNIISPLAFLSESFLGQLSSPVSSLVTVICVSPKRQLIQSSSVIFIG